MTKIAWLAQMDFEPGRWAAQAAHPPLWSNRFMLWHVPSGPLPLHGSDDFIWDPWEGWTEVRSGEDMWLPYFGPGWPGVYRLDVNLDPESRDNVEGADIQISGLSWIGNKYASIGRPASRVTELHWKKFRRWIEKAAPPVSVSSITNPAYQSKVYVFPAARNAIDNNGANAARFL